jgi:hypothetical protein
MSQFGESMSGWLFPKSTIKHISETEQFQVTSSFTKVGQEPFREGIFVPLIAVCLLENNQTAMSCRKTPSWNDRIYSKLQPLSFLLYSTE